MTQFFRKHNAAPSDVPAILFRHLLRFILLCGEFADICQPGLDPGEWPPAPKSDESWLANSFGDRYVPSCLFPYTRKPIVSSKTTPSGQRPLDQLRIRPYEAFDEEDRCGSVGQRIAKMIARHPGRTALIHGTESVSYAQLDVRAGDLMRRIFERQPEAGPETPVGMLTEDAVLRIIGMVAAQKLGRPFLPLDPGAPAGRLQLMLRDSGCSALITDAVSRFRPVSDSFDGEVFQESDDPQPQSVPDRIVSSSATSHLFYTSGSTGQPKSVAQTHAMTLHKMTEYSSSFRINTEDRLSLVASPGFSEAWNAVSMALLNGATLCIREAKHHGIEGLSEWMRDSEVTIFHCVPTLLRALVIGLPDGVFTPHLRILNMGGETIFHADLQSCWDRLAPDCVIVNSYGTTETKLIAHYFADRQTEISSNTIPVGPPIPDTEVRILDDEGSPVPDGEPGEVEVCSRFIARRYERGSALDQGRFSQVNGDPQRIRYLTGDIARFVGGGLLEHLGRCDGIVKLRGHRVELSEVESALQSHPCVRQAAVVVHEPSPTTKQLFAAYISEASPTRDELRDHLLAILPDYMIPCRLISVGALPLSINGKVDRIALLERLLKEVASDAPAKTQAQEESKAPLPATLSKLITIMREVLKTDRVAPDDGFIELGGDSLSATELLLRISQTFEVEISRDELFDAGSLRELADVIEAKAATPDVPRSR